MNSPQFQGFTKPQSNYSKLPHDIINALPQIETLAEMKVILYILRHTWGFQEFAADDFKRITLDEFQNGRKRRDGSRMDNGIGMSRSVIIDGLKRAEEHGFIIIETDDRDSARVKKYYRLNMADESPGVQFSYPSGTETEPLGTETEPRSEKDTPGLDTSGKARSAPQSDSNNQIVEIYYNNKSLVRAMGRVKEGPWSITCDSCGGEVVVTSLDTPHECLCAMREYILLSNKPETRIMKKPVSVEAYYNIVKSKGIAYDSQDDALETLIAETVIDVPFWRQVVVEYLIRGWDPKNVITMLKYYEEGRLPGKRKGEEGGGETTHTPQPTYEPELEDIGEEELIEWAESFQSVEKTTVWSKDVGKGEP